ncbi:MAG: DUF1849 family protein [Hyphomicrobiales bacterium]|nr:DUF1849 family protein [Hyphomicrobiales bacterium]
MNGCKIRRLAVVGFGLVLPSTITAEPLLTAKAVYDLSLDDDELGVMSRIEGAMTTSLTRNCNTYTSSVAMSARLEGPDGSSIPLIVRSKHIEGETSLAFEIYASLAGVETERTEGAAERNTDGISVTVSVPETSSFEIEAGPLFPMELVEEAVAAARAGKTLVEFPSYVGSGGGREVYRISVVIGTYDTRMDSDDETLFAAGLGFADMARWPMTFSYFLPGERDSMTSALTSYSVVYENGFAQAARHDFGPFAMRLTLAEISPIPPTPCR